MSKGALLADEVGLGKTIEASLVIAQRWAERRRRILLIVPASLRKQWSQELYDKFSLPSFILESRTYNEAKKKGVAQPFDAGRCIVITSYEFAAAKAADWRAGSGTWSRSTRRTGCAMSTGRTAQARQGAARRHAGLLQDAADGNAAAELPPGALRPGFGHRREILQRRGGISHRLSQRRRGRGAICRICANACSPSASARCGARCSRPGLINYTERCPLTLHFESSQDEMGLYQAVSAYLQRKDTIAFGDKPNALVTLVVRKILGSSTFAVAETLSQIVERLKEHQPP